MVHSRWSAASPFALACWLRLRVLLLTFCAVVEDDAGFGAVEGTALTSAELALTFIPDIVT